MFCLLSDFLLPFFLVGAVALATSNALLEHEYLYTTDPQPLISTPNQGLMRCNVITPIPVIKGNIIICA